MNKTKITFAILLLVMSLFTAKAQNNIWINGYTYQEINGKQCTLPFATIMVENLKDSTVIEYYTVSGLDGRYQIKPYDHLQQYKYTVEADGFKPTSFVLDKIPEVWNGKPFSGNCNVNIKMTRDNKKEELQINKSVYSKQQLQSINENVKIKSAKELIVCIPNVQYEDGYLETADHKSYCLFLNGMYAAANTFSLLEKLPIVNVENIELYLFNDNEKYAGVINLNLTIGSKPKNPGYTLQESTFVIK